MKLVTSRTALRLLALLLAWATLVAVLALAQPPRALRTGLDALGSASSAMAG